jgi:hypothetical protein
MSTVEVIRYTRAAPANFLHVTEIAIGAAQR